MNIYQLNQSLRKKYSHFNHNFAIKIKEFRNIWLINCYEGCQHLLIQKDIKISQISKIFITDINKENIYGLLGLLSTLSLSTRITELEIYGPTKLIKYIYYWKKYSKTNFRYILYIYHINTTLVANNNIYKIYSFTKNTNNLNYNIIDKEKKGKFKVQKAVNHRINQGPIYGKLKAGYDFILPDGHFIYGVKYIHQYITGGKLTLMCNYFSKLQYSISKKSKIILI